MIQIPLPDKITVDSIHSTVNEINEKIDQIAASTDTYWCGTAAGAGDTFILTTGKEMTELTAGQKFTFFTDRYSDEPWIQIDSCPPYTLNAKIRGMGVMVMSFADHHFYCETAQIHDDLSTLATTLKSVSDNVALVKSSTLTTSVTLEDMGTKVGDQGDDPGTTSLFARLKQIYNHLTLNLSATRTGYIDTIKTTTDTLNTNMNAMKTVVGISNPTTADMATVMNALKKVADSVATISVTVNNSGRGMSRRIFVANGSFVVPAGVTTLFITAAGGGGGGGYAAGSQSTHVPGGNGTATTITGGLSLSLAGGRGASSTGPGTAGGTGGGAGGGGTSPVPAGKGVDGYGGSRSTNGHGGGGSLGGGGSPAGVINTNGGAAFGGTSSFFSGNNSQWANYAGHGAWGGGGGGAGLGDGGGGAAAMVMSSYSVTAGTTLTITIGVGGKGGISGTGTNTYYSGDGGNGIVIIEW